MEGTPVFGEHISCIIITIGVVCYSPLCVREWIVNNAKETLCRILATANTQFGQEMALVMQTTHAQR